MIIIKIIILYFIQIRHTDDFSSTGTRLVIISRPNVQIIRSMQSINLQSIRTGTVEFNQLEQKWLFYTNNM